MRVRELRVLCYVPAHVGCSPNEYADACAKSHLRSDETVRASFALAKAKGRFRRTPSPTKHSLDGAQDLEKRRNDLNFDQDQAAFAFTSFSESGGSSGNAGKINDVDGEVDGIINLV